MPRALSLAALPVLVCSLLASCAHQRAYVEPQLPADQTATVEASVPVWIVAVDGARVNCAAGDRCSIKVPPGPHVLEVTYTGLEPRRTGQDPFSGLQPPPVQPIQGMGTLKLKFAAQAGHVYSIAAERSGPKWSASVHDFRNVGTIIHSK